MEHWQQGRLTANGKVLRYFRAGSGPPVLLVHGFTDNALYWTRTAEALAVEWEVVAYDARGHGASDRASGRFGDAERVGDLAAMVEALGLRRPALVGHSMGAATAALTAARYPGLARCLVLEDPAWWEAAPSETPAEAENRRAQRDRMARDWRAWVEALQAGSREFGLEQVRAHSPGWSAQDQALSLNARLQVEPDLFDHYPQAESPWRAVVAAIDCPILLLLGDNQQRGAIVRVEQAREAESLWRSGRWQIIEGAGHSIRYDRFAAYLAALRAFLEEHPA